jgi:pimeloyl-ACP methyl ester carboxylesterase
LLWRPAIKLWNIRDYASKGANLPKNHMRKYLLTTIAFMGLMANAGQCQTIDTLVDVGGYRLHFRILKGKGMPILFEGGSQADVTVWDTILKPVADVTHATLITYDRPGDGKSELDTSNHDLDRHGILQVIEGLEKGLKRLGYEGNVMLIAHSYGGFCATLYAARHPAAVKAAVFFDCNQVCFFTDAYVDSAMNERKRLWADEKTRDQHLTQYYQSMNLQHTVALMRKSPFPATIPVVDFVAGLAPPVWDSVTEARWKDCHRQFAAAQPNRQGITANGCGHFIFRDNPPLAIAAIAKAYAGTQGGQEGDEIRKRFLSYALDAVNAEKGKEVH